MAKCDYCGTTILFGGERDGDYRYCNATCREHDVLRGIADQIPDEQMRELIEQVRMGSCPLCGGAGPIDVHKSHVCWSVIFLTTFNSTPHVCCKRCAVKKQLTGLAISSVAGWWGFPWGLLFTPIQIGRNIFGLFSNPGTHGPSEHMEKLIRLDVASRIAQRAQDV